MQSAETCVNFLNAVAQREVFSKKKLRDIKQSLFILNEKQNLKVKWRLLRAAESFLKRKYRCFTESRAQKSKNMKFFLAKFILFKAKLYEIKEILQKINTCQSATVYFKGFFQRESTCGDLSQQVKPLLRLK